MLLGSFTLKNLTEIVQLIGSDIRLKKFGQERTTLGFDFDPIIHNSKNCKLRGESYARISTFF